LAAKTKSIVSVYFSMGLVVIFVNFSSHQVFKIQVLVKYDKFFTKKLLVGKFLTLE